MVEDETRELEERGFCVLRSALATSLVDDCRDAFWPVLSAYLATSPEPNRGPARHFLPMPFDPPCFSPGFFFHEDLLRVVHEVMGDRVVADQWGCDVPLLGFRHQNLHRDYARPLFAEAPELALPPYMLVVSFGLIRITGHHGPIEIAPRTHRMSGEEGLEAIRTGSIGIEAVPLEVGDVLVRHPWTLHRGTPNTTDQPRALVTIRYVRRWYADDSREANAIPRTVWRTLGPEQQALMRFPVQ